jgi:hypothetical protein
MSRNMPHLKTRMKIKDKHAEGCEFPFVWTLECFKLKTAGQIIMKYDRKAMSSGAPAI